MMIVTAYPHPFSPQCMRFAHWWIYDLSKFHSFWKAKIEVQPHTFSGSTPWMALLKAYDLHLFSPLQKLIPLAIDYHSHFYRKEFSSKKLRDIFDIFARLGLSKFGHLRRLPPEQLQKRFGKIWADFFRGVLFPETMIWSWQSYQEPPALHWSYEFEEGPSSDGIRVLNEIEMGLQYLSTEHPYFGIEKIQVKLLLEETIEEEVFDIPFIYRPFLKRDLRWIFRLMEERLLHLQLSHPVIKIQLHISPAEAPKALQMSLFETQKKSLALQEFCQRLRDQKYEIFQPASTHSYLPESSWKRSFETETERSSHGIYRPLLQERIPKPISPPDGHLSFTERLTWFDASGIRHERNYFITRQFQKWVWIFKDETHQWFQQGIVE